MPSVCWAAGSTAWRFRRAARRRASITPVAKFTTSSGRWSAVGVAYNVEKFGKTNWYDWGADILLANQDDNGGWTNGEFKFVPDTCFALLFLKKANLAKDLTAALSTQMKDGMGSATLTVGGTSGADLAKVRKPFFEAPLIENPKDKPTTEPDAQATRLASRSFLRKATSRSKSSRSCATTRARPIRKRWSVPFRSSTATRARRRARRSRSGYRA